MPSGSKHIWISIAVLFIVNLIIILTTHITELRLFCIMTNAYLFASFYLSPDLDIDSSVYHRWGVFKFLWWPYKKLCSHRGISHHLLWGPLTILGTLLLISSPVLLLLYTRDYDFNVTVILFSVAVIIFSVEAHIVADKLRL